MIEIVVVDTEKPDKVTEAIMGDHAFVMSAKKREEDNAYDISTIVLGDLSAEALLSNLASAVVSQMKSLSKEIKVPLDVAMLRFIKHLAIARNEKAPDKHEA